MLSVLIADDEELARMRLRALLQDIREPRTLVAAEAASAGEALGLIRDCRCDAVLLDVQMPGMDGIAMAALLRERVPPMAVVFVTAHAEHAVKAFDLEAVDYLTKPVRRERLQMALQRVCERLRPRAAAPDDRSGLVVQDRGRTIRMPLSDVLYLKAELKYVTLRTLRHSYVLEESLAELEARWGDQFLRIHRNALVARRAMLALERHRSAADGDEDAREGWAVQIKGVDEWLAVSRRQLALVREALQHAGS